MGLLDPKNVEDKHIAEYVVNNIDVAIEKGF